MHVQLTDHIAQGRDIQLVGIERVLEQLGKSCSFSPQLRLVLTVQLKQLADIRPSRHQDEPGVIRIVGQQQPTEREVPDRQGVLFKSWI
ncbi:hypothetical protein D3C71_1809810 [compost metagenome]